MWSISLPKYADHSCFRLRGSGHDSSRWSLAGIDSAALRFVAGNWGSQGFPLQGAAAVGPLRAGAVAARFGRRIRIGGFRRERLHAGCDRSDRGAHTDDPVPGGRPLLQAKVVVSWSRRLGGSPGCIGHGSRGCFDREPCHGSQEESGVPLQLTSLAGADLGHANEPRLWPAGAGQCPIEGSQWNPDRIAASLCVGIGTMASQEARKKGRKWSAARTCHTRGHCLGE